MKFIFDTYKKSIKALGNPENNKSTMALKVIRKQFNNDISLGQYKVKYNVTFSRRKSLVIKIEPGKELEVLAPARITDKGISSFLEEKSSWIIKNLEKYKNYHTIEAPLNFLTGETIYYLGVPYKLVIKRDLATDINIDGNEFIVSTPYSEDNPKIRNQIIRWYKKQAQIVFDDSLNRCLEKAAEVGIKKALPIKFRKMEKRWGTCTGDNQIILNSSLIFVDVEYIDYIIYHELAHFREKNHGPKFYALLSAMCPHYKQLRKKLNFQLIENFL